MAVDQLSHNPLHIVTPLLHSSQLSSQLGCSVWLKLECLQPSGSFKIRGIGHMCQTLLAKKKEQNSDLSAVEFISSSGGNAGLAVAYAGKMLGIKTKVFIPTTTPDFIKEKLESESAEVQIVGNVWNETNEHTVKYVKQHPSAIYIPPFDDSLIWDGHATLVEELQQQLPGPPNAILCAVGGGGLLNGVLTGLINSSWKDTTVVAVETTGTAKFHESLKKGEIVALDKVTGIAKSLGALQCSQQCLPLSRQYTESGGKVVSAIVSDKEAAQGVKTLANYHKFLVEAACGAPLFLLSGRIKETLKDVDITPDSHIVCIVCGGSHINTDMLEEWKNMFADSD
ncbi:l-serine dehydratase/L-threonine deaminase-like protein [Paraphysoderma sedebokerense]|nr:l-serine dehydratase/L-threonine deaminase-like protein [Paraphysoderma sedebokerense]